MSDKTTQKARTVHDMTEVFEENDLNNEAFVMMRASSKLVQGGGGGGEGSIGEGGRAAVSRFLGASLSLPAHSIPIKATTTAIRRKLSQPHVCMLILRSLGGAMMRWGTESGHGQDRQRCSAFLCVKHIKRVIRQWESVRTTSQAVSRCCETRNT